MACMCGDYCCPSCGPAQGNWRCPICRLWASDGCDHIDEDAGTLKPEFEAEAERLASEEAEADDRMVRETYAETVPCAICHNPCPAATAHLHQGEWIGDACCWDERLRASE